MSENKNEQISTEHQITFDINNLDCYSWVKKKGYEGTLSDFVNEVIHSYFDEEHRLKLALCSTCPLHRNGKGCIANKCIKK